MNVKEKMEPEEFTGEILNDHKLFRYGVDKRPALPHEREECGSVWILWILTDQGYSRAKKLFTEMFPDHDFEKDSGLMCV